MHPFDQYSAAESLGLKQLKHNCFFFRISLLLGAFIYVVDSDCCLSLVIVMSADTC